MKRFGFVAAVLAVLGTVSVAEAADKPNLTLCTGGKSGNYFFAGEQIGNRVNNAFNVKIETTAGSLDNLRRLSQKECDMAFVQSDVYDLYQMENPTSVNTLQSVKAVYDEYVHVLCPVKANIGRITEVGKKNMKMYVGADGGGTAETWRALRRADEKLYGKLERLTDAGVVAANAVKDSADSCMVWVSGLNSGDMQAANIMSANTRDRKPALTLISVDDRDFKDIKNSRGQPMYRFETIERKAPRGDKPGLYNNIMQSSNVTVPVVSALLVTRKDYYKEITAQMPRLILAIEDASPTIWNKVNPAQ